MLDGLKSVGEGVPESTSWVFRDGWTEQGERKRCRSQGDKVRQRLHGISSSATGAKMFIGRCTGGHVQWAATLLFRWWKRGMFDVSLGKQRRYRSKSRSGRRPASTTCGRGDGFFLHAVDRLVSRSAMGASADGDGGKAEKKSRPGSMSCVGGGCEGRGGNGCLGGPSPRGLSAGGGAGRLT